MKQERSGTRAATKHSHLRQIRTSESIEEICNLPVAFDVTTDNHSAIDILPNFNRSCSFTTYEQLMRNFDAAHRAVRTTESLAELAAFPTINDEQAKTPTLNKKLHSVDSLADLHQISELLGPTPTNSDYAYYPPVLRNSDYAVHATPESTVTPTNSAYCYVNADGSSRLVDSCQPRSPSINPYANISRYRMERPVTPTASYLSVGSKQFPSEIYTGQWDGGKLKPTSAPQNATLNKKMLSTNSEVDVAQLEVSFSERCTRGEECTNRRLLSAESHYELQQIPSIEAFDEEKFRDFSLQSLEDLHRLPSISSYQLARQDEPEKDVKTACSIHADSEDNFKYFPEAVRRH